MSRQTKLSIGTESTLMKPIIFNTKEVKAILDGRKTQTRRVIKDNGILPSGNWLGEIREGGSWCSNSRNDVLWTGFRSESGADSYFMCRWKPGDILWVRETWIYLFDGPLAIIPMVGYKADMGNRIVDTIPDGKMVYNVSKLDAWKWRSSIHMPREAARIFLKVKRVWVERLQEITEEDAIAEGFEPILCDCLRLGRGAHGCTDCMNTGVIEPAMVDFVDTWNELNTKRGYPFESNPWVFAIEFEIVEMNKNVFR